MRPEEVIGKTIAEMEQLEADGELDWPACWPIVEDGIVTGIVRAGDTIGDDVWFDPEIECYRRDAGENLPVMEKDATECPECGALRARMIRVDETAVICGVCRRKFRLG